MESSKEKILEWNEFMKVEMRVGTIISSEEFKEVRNPAYKIVVDFGEFGQRKTSAQITELYNTKEIIGKQVIAVINFPPKQIAIAERINRTLNYEHGLRNCIKNTDIAQQITKQAVSIYNNLRTHFSLGLRKPAEVHLNPNIKYKSYRRNNVNLTELLI
jgi:export-related chaperone CsaA